MEIEFFKNHYGFKFNKSGFKTTKKRPVKSSFTGLLNNQN